MTVTSHLLTVHQCTEPLSVFFIRSSHPPKLFSRPNKPSSSSLSSQGKWSTPWPARWPSTEFIHVHQHLFSIRGPENWMKEFKCGLKSGEDREMTSPLDPINCSLGCFWPSLLPGHTPGSCPARGHLAILVAHSSNQPMSLWMAALPSNVLTGLPFNLQSFINSAAEVNLLPIMFCWFLVLVVLEIHIKVCDLRNRDLYSQSFE